MSDRGAAPAALVLGGAQLGLDYGVANQTGMMSEAAAVALLRRASAIGVRAVDAARAYGAAEARIGAARAAGVGPFELITKLSPLAVVPPDAAPEEAAQAAADSLAASLRALGQRSVDALLLHRAAHRTDWSGAVWATLRRAREDGRVARLGVSIEIAADLPTALADPEVGHIQLALNALDWRWRAPEILEAIAARPDVVIHARSVFLQGLLLMPASAWPAPLQPWAGPVCEALDQAVVAYGRKNRADLAIAYARSIAWLSGLVVGVDGVAQLEETAALFERPPLTSEERDALIAALPQAPETVLRPALWPRA